MPAPRQLEQHVAGHYEPNSDQEIVYTCEIFDLPVNIPHHAEYPNWGFHPEEGTVDIIDPREARFGGPYTNIDDFLRANMTDQELEIFEALNGPNPIAAADRARELGSEDADQSIDVRLSRLAISQNLRHSTETGRTEIADVAVSVTAARRVLTVIVLKRCVHTYRVMHSYNGRIPNSHTDLAMVYQESYNAFRGNGMCFIIPRPVTRPTSNAARVAYLSAKYENLIRRPYDNCEGVGRNPTVKTRPPRNNWPRTYSE